MASLDAAEDDPRRYGEIFKVAGPLVVASRMSGAFMHELVRVGTKRIVVRPLYPFLIAFHPVARAELNPLVPPLPAARLAPPITSFSRPNPHPPHSTPMPTRPCAALSSAAAPASLLSRALSLRTPNTPG